MKLLSRRVNTIFQPSRLLAAEQRAKTAKSLISMPELLGRARQRLRWLQPILIGLGTVSLGVLAPSTAHALSTGNVSIQMVTDDQLVVDSNYCSSNQGPRAAYVGFKVTNTSSAAINSLQVDLAGLTNGFSLAGGQAVSQYVGTLNAGESRTIYWYVQYSISCAGGGGFTTITSTLTVTAKDANPGTVSGTGNIQTASYISANAGGQITSSVLGPGYVAGQLIPYDVTYSFGGASSGDRYNLQPAGNLTYNAACFQLEKSQILSSAVTAIPTGTVDKLFFTASTSQPGSGYQVQVRYFIRYLCANTSTTAKPYAGQTSGNTNKKYTGNYETWIATSFPIGTNAFSISKAASTSNLPNGGNVTYTVTVTNTSAYDARIERIVDTLPAGVTFSGIATGSNVTAANSSSVPAVGATGTLTWIGQSPNYYSIPAQSSIKLIYTATIPNTPGSYQNSVSATTGNTTTATASTTVTVTPLVTVSGKVWDDADNSANNTFTNINTGGEIGTNAGGLFAILVNASGSVIGSTPVNSDGTYSFNNITSGQSNVTIRLSTTAGTVGSAAPATALPINWINTSPLVQTAFNIGTSNISGKDFGIEQLPNTNDVIATSQNNPGGTNTVQVSALSGTDPEDGNLGTGKSFRIVMLPTNGTLYYDGVVVTAGRIISSYDPTKLTLDPNDGTLTVSFTYAAIDAAGKEDPTPATVSMPFAAPTTDLSVTKTDGQVSTTAGSPITYIITVTNNGPSTVNSLTLTDALPAVIQSPIFTSSTGTYNSSTGIWTGLNLASSRSITLTISGTLSTSAVGTLTNTVTVAPSSGITDPIPGNNTATDNTVIYAIAPTAGQIVINEVLYTQTGTGLNATTNDEFIELYNASSSSVNLSGWKLVDGNLIENSTDSTGSLTGSSVNPAYSFPNGTILAPGQYAVIWIGSNTLDHQAPGATFQTWLNQPPKLNNAGDDVWLYDSQLRIVDYIAYGTGSAINTPPPGSLNLWNAAYQASLASTNAGQSISLTPNGVDGNSSACWEPTTSGQSNGRCTGYLPTTDTDTVGTRITTIGQNNNGTVAPNLVLVKRITAINGVEVAGFVDDPGSTDDNTSTFPSPSTYLRGAINGGLVRPGDVLEYTIYFLSNGGAPATNVSICDLVPVNSTFVSNAFNGMSPEDTGGLPGVDRGIALGLSATSFPTVPTTYLSNVQDGDRAQFFPPGTTPPISCSGINSSGAVVVNVVTSPSSLPPATATSTPANSYGFIRFQARVQ